MNITAVRALCAAPRTASQRPEAKESFSVPQPAGVSRATRFTPARAINKNDPSTWYGTAVETPVMDASEDLAQMLSEDQFNALLSGASVPTPVSSSARVDSLVTVPSERGPESAGDAIAAGLRLFQAGNAEGALELFETSLQLPGTGVLRFKGKPRDLSTGERQAALYNCACCHAVLGNERDGLLAIAACLENGFDNFALLRNDKDLAPLRANPKYEGLLSRFEPKGASGFLAQLFGGKR